MKKLLLFVLAAMAFAACTQNEVEELTANRADASETLTVGFEGDDTRIELNEVCKTVWSAGDEASVFYHSNANQRWAFQGETGDRIGTLKRVANAEATAQMTNVVVVYPYNTNYWLNYANGNIEATLPAVQSYKEGSYGADGNIMVAQSEFTQFSLKSVCGWLRVELTGKRHIVNSITLRGNAGEQVAGLIYVDTATAEATLASEMGAASDEDEMGGVGGGLEFDDTIFREVTLDCGSGVMLGSEATAFYIALLPQTFERGMTIDINYANAEPQTLICESSITIRRNHIAPVNSEAESEAIVPTNQLWYTATALVEPYNTSAFNAAIVSNEWDEATGEGVIAFDGELTTIGDSAFYYCRSLTSVTIPDSVTTIGYGAFRSCHSLTSVTIPDSVTTIGNQAFCYCSSLTSVTIPDSVTAIGESAFYGCSSLTSVTIPNSVTTIGHGAFGYCDSLAEFKGKFAADGGRCLIKDNTLIAYAEASGTTYTIPDSVTTIGDRAFYDCLSLTSVTIPDSVTAIGEGAFFGCYSLTSVVIPSSVTMIGGWAFQNCDSLTSVTIPDSVTTIGNFAFYACLSLAEFKGKFAADDGRCLIKDNAIIAYAEASGTTYTIPDYVTTIGDWAFYYCRSLTSVTIPDSVTTIGDWAFLGCDSLTSVTIGDSVTTIGKAAFRSCGSLTSVTIPDSVTTIGEDAFLWCESLTSVTIGDSVTTIGEAAFCGCDSLTSVTIGDSVTAIGVMAFCGCKSLTSVYCKATTPPTLGDDVFKYYDNGYVNLGCAIYVPAESVEAYKTAENWSDYATDILAYDFETGEVVDTTPANEL